MIEATGDVVVVGSGIAGTVLARALHRRGVDVLLVERHRHPRFALGESSTPLAAIALERLARDFGLGDLHTLAAYGRWQRCYPEVMRGLKRGFTFLGHTAGTSYLPRTRRDEQNLLMVAASPDAAVADAQWLRSDVDAFLFGLAKAEGVRTMELAVVEHCEVSVSGVLLLGRQGDSAMRLRGEVVVDASGGAAVVGRGLGLATDELAWSRRLLFGHAESLPEFPWRRPDGLPYPDEWAAVHHLLGDRWMYQLRFDDGRVSLGLIWCEAPAESGPVVNESAARDCWLSQVAAFPALAAALAQVRWKVGPRMAPPPVPGFVGAAGERFALLPQAFRPIDPLFSTGIAWSLVAVERLAETLSRRGGDRAAGLRRYDWCLRREARHLESLVRAAYRCMSDFPAFVAVAHSYFVAASWCELRQRLFEPEEVDWGNSPPGEASSLGGNSPVSWAWAGFLGADDPALSALVAIADEASAGVGECASNNGLFEQLRAAAASRNVAGFFDAARPALVPLDLSTLAAHHGVFGLGRSEMERRLLRLRS